MREEMKKLKANRTRFINELDVSIEFLASLEERKVITNEHKSKISTHEKVDFLIDILGRRGDANYEKFCDVLWNHNKELADLLSGSSDPSENCAVPKEDSSSELQLYRAAQQEAIEVNAVYRASSCDSQKSSKCFEGLADTFAFAGALMRAVNQWTLTSSCAVIGATSKCVQNYGCTDTEDISVEWGWTGIKDSLNYLCTDGKQGLVKFQTCMTRNVESYYAQLLGCLELIAEPKAKTDCSYYNSQLACYAGAARDHCGSEEFAVKYYTKAYQPMTTLELGCQYSYEKNRLF